MKRNWKMTFIVLLILSDLLLSCSADKRKELSKIKNYNG